MPRQAETPEERLRRQARRAWTFARNAEEWIAAIETDGLDTQPELALTIGAARDAVILARRKLAELLPEERLP